MALLYIKKNFKSKVLFAEQHTACNAQVTQVTHLTPKTKTRLFRVTSRDLICHEKFRTLRSVFGGVEKC